MKRYEHLPLTPQLRENGTWVKYADAMERIAELEDERDKYKAQLANITGSDIVQDAARWKRVEAAFYMWETGGPEYELSDVLDVIREAMREGEE